MSTSARDIIQEHYPRFDIKRAGKIVTDTSEFTRIDHGDVISLETGHYLVLRDEAERRFGIEDPKYWVKRCRHLETGDRKILKLVFYEEFPMKIGKAEIQCFRSPRKEARILDLVQGDPRFMQGVSVEDEAGNNVRILDVVAGKRLDLKVEAMDMDHETYFREAFPDILSRFADACRAIAFLHQHGEKHGDIRRDHLYVDRDTKDYVWIDFDYTFDFHENPFGLDIFNLGNALLYFAGKNHLTFQDVAHLDVAFTEEDASLVIPNRVANLRKVYPYIPESLNFVLLHFSAGATVFYESVDEMLDDLSPCLDELGCTTNQGEGHG